MPPDLVARVRQIAAEAHRKAPNPMHDKREVLRRCPELVAWLRDWQEATGDRATLLRATVDGAVIYAG
jgi:hypothetical protein